MRNILIGAVTFNAPLGEIDANLEKMISLVREAKSNNAELICFPEMCITGYCSDGSAKNHALNINNSVFEKLQSVSTELEIVILAGFTEKDNGGKIYASHIVVSPLTKSQVYRKVYIAPPEKKTYTAAGTVPVFEIDGFCFGIQLCYDAHFPELSTFMTEKGVDAIFIPHASPRLTPGEKYDSWMRHLPARAFDNSIYIIACNQNGDNCNGLNFPGVSIIIDPSGKVVGRDISGQDSILYAHLYKDALENVRGHKMKYFFPNRRKSLYL